MYDQENADLFQIPEYDENNEQFEPQEKEIKNLDDLENFIQ